MARTFNDLKRFNDDADRNFYLSCLSNRIKETGFICTARVLMDTPVHLLIRTTELPLWKLMKPLTSDYAHYYHKKFSRRGPLFSDRYKSIATQDRFYLEQRVRYLHLAAKKGIALDGLIAYYLTPSPFLPAATNRDSHPDKLTADAKPGDGILLMGARDPSLPKLANKIISVLEGAADDSA